MICLHSPLFQSGLSDLILALSGADAYSSERSFLSVLRAQHILPDTSTPLFIIDPLEPATKSYSHSLSLDELQQLEWPHGKQDLNSWASVLDRFDEVLERATVLVSDRADSAAEWTLSLDSKSPEHAEVRNLIVLEFYSRMGLLNFPYKNYFLTAPQPHASGSGLHHNSGRELLHWTVRSDVRELRSPRRPIACCFRPRHARVHHAPPMHTTVSDYRLNY